MLMNLYVNPAILHYMDALLAQVQVFAHLVSLRLSSLLEALVNALLQHIWQVDIA